MKNLRSFLARWILGKGVERPVWASAVLVTAGVVIAVRFIAVGIGLFVQQPPFFEADAAICFGVAIGSLIIALCGLTLARGARRFVLLLTVFWIAVCSFLYRALAPGDTVNSLNDILSNRAFNTGLVDQQGNHLLAMAIVLTVFTIVSVALLGPHPGSRGVGSALFDEHGTVRWNKLWVVLAVAIFAGIVLGDTKGAADFVGVMQPTSTFGDSAFPHGLGAFGAWFLRVTMVPISLFAWAVGLTPEPRLIVPMLIVLAWVTGRIQVTENRIQISVLGLSLVKISFDKIRRCDLLFHGREADTAVLYTKMFGLIPMAIGIHAKHWQNGNRIVDQIWERCRAFGIRTSTWRSPRWMVWTAYALIACGAAVAVIHELSYARIWQPFFSPEFDMNNYWRIAAVGQTTAMTLVPVVLIGCGLGMLSAYHRAATRPYLMMLWMLIAFALPTPLIHWLVWIAIYAIDAATLGTHSHTPIPNMVVWQNCFVIVSLVPAFAGASYLLGCIAGCRRIDKRPQEASVPAELPTPVKPAKGGIVSHASV